MSTYCFSALDDVPNRRNNKSYFLMNLYFTRFTVDFDIFRPFWSRILKIQSSIVHYRGFGVSSGLFFARQVATHDTPAGFDSQCRILSDAQIGALVVRTFSERFVGASCKIQSHLYRSWPAIHTYRQRPKIATMTRSRPIAPPWP